MPAFQLDLISGEHPCMPDALVGVQVRHPPLCLLTLLYGYVVYRLFPNASDLLGISYSFVCQPYAHEPLQLLGAALDCHVVLQDCVLSI